MAVAYVEPPAPSHPQPGGMVDPASAALAAGVDAILAAPLADLPDAILVERQRTVLVQVERLRMAALLGLRAIESRHLYADDGAGSAGGWMRAQPVVDDRSTVQTARQVDSMPTVRAEAVAGRLSVRDLQLIAGALARVPADVDEERLQAVIRDGVGSSLFAICGGDAEAMRQARARLDVIADSVAPPVQRCEQAFVLLAQTMAARLPAGRLRVVLADLVDALLPEAHDARAARKHAARGLSLRPVFDGGWHLRGFLDDDTGALLRTSLDRFATVVPQEWQTGSEFTGKDQQEHDALHAALAHLHAGSPPGPVAAVADERPAAGAPATSAREAAVHVAPGIALTLTAPAAALLRESGALPARLGDLMRIAPATLERLACGSTITDVLIGSDGRVVHVGRARRDATRAQRIALQTRWGGLCAVAGCGLPATIPHHVIPYSEGGTTDLNNLVPLCHHNHHDVHTGRKNLRLRDGRWIGPHGWADGPSP